MSWQFRMPNRRGQERHVVLVYSGRDKRRLRTRLSGGRGHRRDQEEEGYSQHTGFDHSWRRADLFCLLGLAAGFRLVLKNVFTGQDEIVPMP
jgi:hypothetical protein